MSRKLLLAFFLVFTNVFFSQENIWIENDIEKIENFLFSYKTKEALGIIDCLLLSNELNLDQNTRVKVLKIEALVKSELFDSGLRLADEILNQPSLKIEYKIKALLMRALLYEHTEDLENSYEDLQSVARLYKMNDLPKDENFGVFLFRFSSWYRLNDQKELALEYATKANAFGKEYNYKNVISTSYLLLGLTHYDYDLKRNYFNKALKEFKSYDDLHGIVAMYNSLTRLEIEKLQTEPARRYNDSLIGYLNLTEDNFFASQALLNKSKIFEMESNLDSSLLYFQKFHNTRLKDIENERTLHTRELQFRLDLEEDKLKNNELQQNLASERAWKINLYLAGSGLLLLMGASIGHMAVLSRKKTKIKFQADEISKANNALQQSLLDKEILLKEIFHRVKNNLALIHSLIEFQIDDTSDEIVKEKFERLENRVKAISLAHQQFMPATVEADVRKYDLQEYLETIVASYREIDSKKIDFKSQIAPVILSLDKALPIGILVNELISNTTKHARTNGGNLKVYFSLSATTHDINLIYSDNGIEFKEVSKESLGMFIIESMVQQLKGRISRKNSRYEITLKI